MMLQSGENKAMQCNGILLLQGVIIMNNLIINFKWQMSGFGNFSESESFLM